MKKLMLAFAFCGMLRSAYAAALIAEDFYLNNENMTETPGQSRCIVLPNTLRVVLCEGEQAELYADTLPAEAAKGLLWSVSSKCNAAGIYPAGEVCRVVALRVGSEQVTVRAQDGSEAKITVEIIPQRQESFFAAEPVEDISEKKDEPRLRAEQLGKILFLCGAALALPLPITMLIKRRRKK